MNLSKIRFLFRLENVLIIVDGERVRIFSKTGNMTTTARSLIAMFTNATEMKQKSGGQLASDLSTSTSPLSLYQILAIAVVCLGFLKGLYVEWVKFHQQDQNLRQYLPARLHHLWAQYGTQVKNWATQFVMGQISSIVVRLGGRGGGGAGETRADDTSAGGGGSGGSGGVGGSGEVGGVGGVGGDNMIELNEFNSLPEPLHATATATSISIVGEDENRSRVTPKSLPELLGVFVGNNLVCPRNSEEEVKEQIP